MLFSKIDKSYELTTGMAERLGHDLVADLQKDPELGARALRAAVMRCTQCKEQGACRKLLAENETLEAAPAYCRNDFSLTC